MAFKPFPPKKKSGKSNLPPQFQHGPAATDHAANLVHALKGFIGAHVGAALGPDEDPEEADEQDTPPPFGPKGAGHKPHVTVAIMMAHNVKPKKKS